MRVIEKHRSWAVPPGACLGDPGLLGTLLSFALLHLWAILLRTLAQSSTPYQALAGSSRILYDIGMVRTDRETTLQVAPGKIELTHEGRRRALAWTQAAARYWWTLAILIVVLGKVLEMTQGDGLLLFDAAVFAIIGRGILNGQLPYRDYWDHKPPGIYYIDAGILRVFPNNPWTFHLVEIPVAIVAVAVFYWLTRGLARRPASAIATLCFAWFYTSLPFDLGGNLTETYWVIPVAFAFGTLIRYARAQTTPDATARPHSILLLLSGTALACASLLKPQALGEFVFFELVILAVSVFYHRAGESRRFVDAGLPILGAAPIALVLIAYLTAYHLWVPFWSQVIVYNQVYSQAASVKLALELLRGQRNGWEMWVCGVVAAITTLVAWAERRQSPGSLRIMVPILSIWLLISMVATASDRQFYGHDFLLSVVPCMAAVGLALDTTASVWPPSWVRLARQPSTYLAGLLCLTLVVALKPIVRSDATAVHELERFSLSTAGAAPSTLHTTAVPPARVAILQVGGVALTMSLTEHWEERLVSRVVRLTRPTDSIFAWGLAPDLYFDSGRRPATAFLYSMPFVNLYGAIRGPGFDTASLHARLLRELRTSRPKLVVIQRSVYFPISFVPRVIAFVTSRYRQEGQFHGYDLWVLRNSRR